jgi:DNA-binding protein YbaB
MAVNNRELWARYDQLLTTFERTRRQLGEVQEKAATLSGSATSKDGMVTATVGPRGTLTALTFHARALRRLSPTELAEAVVATVQQATDDVQAKAAQLYQPFLPKRADYAELLRGEVDLSAYVPERPITHENFDEWWAQFNVSETPRTPEAGR